MPYFREAFAIWSGHKIVAMRDTLRKAKIAARKHKGSEIWVDVVGSNGIVMNTYKWEK